MTDPKYRPTNVHDSLVRISEECAELSKVVCKALRFGIYDMHPKKKQRNIQLLITEWHDINDAMNDFLKFNNDAEYPPVNPLSIKQSEGGKS